MEDLLCFTVCGDGGMFQLFINIIIFSSQWLQSKQEGKKKKSPLLFLVTFPPLSLAAKAFF